MPNISEARVLIIATDGVEQAELTTPRDELRRAGAKVDVATPSGEAIRGWNMTDWGDTIPADLGIGDVNCDDYQALVIPGGVINPDKLRVDDTAMEVVQYFLNSDKLVAAVCHGPWLLVQADACDGRRMTSYHSIRTDVENAGADWVDEEVVQDGAIITSRNPKDLPAFSAKIVEALTSGAAVRAAE
ncbi:protease I [Roseiarcus fermentans]|uniref:Protease I n=1 Tax=Roseiarcus fermentans TaxID=1473586 RepID=A0A366F3G1_9HYPH|nr:type 1 glutamine amidotransferase domain-containing protein [Roseiarcus fermentans]RBP09134.1 protease I [Roseiarcus fermentans]